MPKCANPLFLKWVKGFHAEKDYKKHGGPPRATGYENAIRALQDCTVRYEHPAEMKGKVTGVGPTTIERLVDELEKYCEKNGIDIPELPVKKKTVAKAKAPTKAKMAKPKASNLTAELDTDFEEPVAPKAKAAKRKASTSKVEIESESDDYAVPKAKKRKTINSRVEVDMDSEYSAAPKAMATKPKASTSKAKATIRSSHSRIVSADNIDSDSD